MQVESADVYGSRISTMGSDFTLKKRFASLFANNITRS